MEQIINFLQGFVYNIMLALAPIVAGFILVWIKAKIAVAMEELQAKKPKLSDAIRQAVSLGVQAAEQAGAAGLIEEKKAYAITIAQKWLDNEGWDEFDISILEAAIEAEVNKLYPNSGAGRVTSQFTGW